jgi:cell fate regulator YaaT (PSP1 superfamily)
LPNVVGVRFKSAGKVYYFDPDNLDVSVGSRVIVETARGIEYGEVSVGAKVVADNEVVAPLKKVIRIATDKDREQVEENRKKEKEAFDIGLKKIEAHGLEMRLVDVEFTFDGSKIIFYFTADGRIDFRELVKDLASVFRTRIEMRQIGVRDEAKMLGGIGPCGKALCCATFLGDFAPVSIRMAKDQNLSLNPTKISGICGRLMCCLRYESEVYEEAKAQLPDVGSKVLTPEGLGKVVGHNPLKGNVIVELEGKRQTEVSAKQVEVKERPKGKQAPPPEPEILSAE